MLNMFKIGAETFAKNSVHTIEVQHKKVNKRDKKSVL